MDIIDITALCLFLYSITTTIALIIADFKVKENFTWKTAAICFVWPLSVIAYILNRLWEKVQ